MKHPPDPMKTLNLASILFTWNDIYQVVNHFYTLVAKDPMLRIPFSSVDEWPHHIERLTHFWWIRFGGDAYLDVRYNPVGKHFESGFNNFFLERWLEIFHQVLAAQLTAPQAQLWSEISISMGESLNRNNSLMILRAREGR